MNDLQASALEQQVDEVIAAYLEAERAGRAPHPDQLLVRHPDLADELRSFFADRRCFARLAGPPAYHGNGKTTTREPPVPPAPSLPTIDAGRYVGLQPHARGGLGEVFTAIDTELHRVVAVKRLQDSHANNAPSKRHFLLEAEVTARLDHPGVVPVHSLFRDERDRPCYAMRFIEGQTLDDALRAYHAGPPDPVGFHRLLRCFIQVCETIAYAHSRGVLHRDLKPKNIMLGKFGETVVVDWGLAKVIGRTGDERSTNAEATLRPEGESSDEQTEMGAAVGTPAYMSPEQAAGRWDVIDHRTDLYGLGAMLYMVLTGQAPMEKGNWPELQQKIQRGEFPRPCAVNSAVSRGLEAVCLKAMALRPEDRYQSARALAADVELWLADEPVPAYRESATERLRRWARRRKGLVGSAIIALVILLVSGWIISGLKAEADLAKAETDYEQLLRERMRQSALGSQLDSGRNARVMGELMIRHDKFDKEASATLDWMAGQVGHDPHWDRPEFRRLRKDLLQKAITFWSKAIEIDTPAAGSYYPQSGREMREERRELLRSVLKSWDKANEMATNAAGPPGWRTYFYRSQRALCLARLGDHEGASKEAENLAKEKKLSSEAAYDLARVYGVCAAAAADNRGLAERYAGRAIEFLRKAAEEDYFEEAARRSLRRLGASTVGLLGSPPGQGPLLAASAVFPGRSTPAEHLYNDPDLGHLWARADFRKLLQEVHARPK